MAGRASGARFTLDEIVGRSQQPAAEPTSATPSSQHQQPTAPAAPEQFAPFMRAAEPTPKLQQGGSASYFENQGQQADKSGKKKGAAARRKKAPGRVLAQASDQGAESQHRQQQTPTKTKGNGSD